MGLQILHAARDGGPARRETSQPVSRHQDRLFARASPRHPELATGFTELAIQPGMAPFRAVSTESTGVRHGSPGDGGVLRGFGGPRDRAV